MSIKPGRFQKKPTPAKKKGAKTFKSEEAAKKYAEANGIKEYTLKNLKNDASSTKKIKIIVK